MVKDPEILLTEADIKSYMKMLLLAVAHCHKHWVLHRDIKPSNCLIANDGTLQLGDFGLAKIYGSPDRDLSNQVRCDKEPIRAPLPLFSLFPFTSRKGLARKIKSRDRNKNIIDKNTRRAHSGTALRSYSTAQSRTDRLRMYGVLAASLANCC